jgi:hypothetical protein
MNGVSRSIANEGWRLARDRLNAAIGSGPGGGALLNPNIPLGETLYWLSVIEDDEERPGSKSYIARRASSTDGQTVAGLIFVRNLVTHELLMPVELRVGGYGSAAWGSVPYGGGTSWRWKTRAELGSPTDKYGRDTQYDVHVAGKELHIPIEAAARFFGL